MRLAFLMLMAGCGELAKAPAEPEQQQKNELDENLNLGYGQGASGSGEEGRVGRAAGAPSPKDQAPGSPATAMEAMGDMDINGLKDKGKTKNSRERGEDNKKSEGKKAALRSWFPESFLWEPLVETGANGEATVQVRVPDSLTTWRVLALGVTQEGAQGGALTSFRSTLPAYVDLKLPALLHAGDRLSVPIQVVNQTGELLLKNLVVDAQGGIGSATGKIQVGPYGSALEHLQVTVDRAGTLLLEAGLEGLDRLQKTVPVLPVGRPVEQIRGGTLAAEREFSLDTPPEGRDGSVEVLVFSGSLSVLSAEIARASGGLPWDDAYVWSLMNSADPLVTAGAISEDARRETRLLALQRMRKFTRNNAVAPSVAVLSALRGSDKESLEGKLAIRLEESLKVAQAPDGLWPGASTGLDDILVSTAQTVWALGPENRANRLRAQGAFERYRDRLNNPYVAAWALVANSVEPQRVEVLKKLVQDSIQTAPDGSKYLPATGNRGDGSRATNIESTALAALIFKEDKALSSDLITYILGHRSAGAGFGDGLSSMVALQAMEAVLGSDVPKEARVSLQIDGTAVAEGVLDPKQPFAPIRMVVPVSAGSHTIKLAPATPIPGLAFSVTQRSYMPWVQADPAGLDLVVSVPEQLSVGETSMMGLRVTGPVGALVETLVGLPPGAVVSTPALDALVSSGQIQSYSVQEGAVLLRGVTLEQGSWSGTLPITPGFSGEIQASASYVRQQGSGEDGFYRVPAVWEID